MVFFILLLACYYWIVALDVAALSVGLDLGRAFLEALVGRLLTLLTAGYFGEFIESSHC